MASKNSINKPKIRIQAHKHSKTLVRKRLALAKRLAPSRSSTGRYAEKNTTAPRPTDSRALALYVGEVPTNAGVITNNTLSNKRAKKIARNQRYVAQRNAKNGDKEIEMKDSPEASQSKLDKVKEALWKVVENQANLKVIAQGEGTTLGIQAF